MSVWCVNEGGVPHTVQPEDIARILEATIPEPGQDKAARQETDGAVQEQEVKQDSEDDGNDDQNPPNGGTLILDATCCPADISYPQGHQSAQQIPGKAGRNN